MAMALFFAPLGYGAATPLTLAILDGLLASSFLAWVILLVVQKRVPRPPLLCVGCVLFLAILGSLHWANPRSVHYEVFWVFNDLDGHIPWLPGTVDRAATQPVVSHLFVLLLAFLVLLDATSVSTCRWLLLRVLALSGFVIALVGISQKAGGAESMLWSTPQQSGALFFGAFRYHANAASFLNLSWLAALAVWLRSRDNESNGLGSSLWATVLLVTVIGVFVNTSKAGQMLGVVGLIIAAIRFRRNFLAGTSSRVVTVLSIAVCVGVIGIALLPSVVTSFDRWSGLISKNQFAGRLQAYELCLKMLPDSGWFGFGPGTFRLIFPFYREGADDALGPFFWYHAHQDYLQTLIEWGYLGMAAWLTIFVGGGIRGTRAVLGARRHEIAESSVSCSLLAVFIVLLHGGVDFPFQIPAIQLQVAVYLAMLWTAHPSHQHRSHRRK